MNIQEMRKSKQVSLTKTPLLLSKRSRRLHSLFSAKDGQDRIRLFAEIHKEAQYNGTGFDRPIDEMVKLYDKYADAIVLVTDNILFKGDPKWVKLAAPLTDKPLIVLDLFLYEDQIDEVYAYGADAIVLIVALLSVDELQRLYQKSTLLGLDTIIEVQDARELEIAVRLGARIIGINARDINDLKKVDMDKIANLSQLAPRDIELVAESGIRNGDDVKKYCHDTSAIWWAPLCW